MNKEEIFNYEQNKLNDVIKSINEKIQIAQKNLDDQKHFIIGFKEGQRGTQFIRQDLMSIFATEIHNLKLSLPNPYFGKFDFQDSDNNEIDQIYIGKRNITDNKGNIISHDWRSPVCSMYYDYNIGNAEYKSNGKTHKGKILSKRQLVIKDSKLISVDEQDTLSDDQILMKYLTENSDARLKSIIATIQKEQNKIIRSPLKDYYIIQGTAGSGKTTVALHRIAYLIYNEAKNINETDFMILGPNKYFLDYISNLLPDLDINNVYQSTFEDIALKNINCKVKIESKNTTLKNVLSHNIDENIISYKNTINYLQLIRMYIEQYIKSHLKEDIVYEGIVLCNKEKLKSIYEETPLNKNKSYKERIDNFIKLLIKQIKDNSEDLCHKVWEKYRGEFLSLPKDSKRREEIIKITESIQSEIKKGCSKQVKEYFNFIKVNPLIFYQTFIENIDKFNVELPVDINKLKEYTLEKIKAKKISFEDLTALLFINYNINGVKDYEKYAHIVIDEAQDLSYAQYYILKLIFPKANFDIFGDVNQSIYNYQSIHDWNKLNDIIFDSNAKLLELNKSYRTTLQISNAANLVLENMNQNVAECISRGGREVLLKETSNDEIKIILDEINNYLDKYQTIAIICKDDVETDKLYNKLKKLNLNINKISEQNEKYSGGICIIPSYLSKGLEFDTVILYNANDTNYTNSEIDMKLLYVSMTRAMHELCINYSGKLTMSLQSLLDNNILKNKEKVKSL